MLCLLLPAVLFAQQKELKGMVMVKTSDDKISGLPAASVHWQNTAIGTTTNDKGWFTIPFTAQTNKLIFSYVGYKTDTLTVVSTAVIHHFLQEISSVDEVVVTGKKETVSNSFYAAVNKITLNESELLKAACCNLAESFETNPAVDVNFSDAVTGNKQIRMLGLNSPYILIAKENIPSVRGASQVYGMSFIPGTWIESIQITKGMGSVVNGYESISGQINAELKKPRGHEYYFVNAYANAGGRMELNFNTMQTLNEKWSTGVFVHGNARTLKNDQNNDGFLDMPLGNQINLLNRWQYANPETGLVSFVDLKYVNDKKQIGQTFFNPNTDKFTTNAYGGEVFTERVELVSKLGYVFKEKPYQNMGLQAAFSSHDQNSYVGYNVFDIHQKSLYVNGIFQSILSNTMHKYKTGITYTMDLYDEQVLTEKYQRDEKAIGAFFEYTYDNIDNFTLVAGARIDHHTVMGTFVTPRLHIRYAPWETGVLKMSAGKGQRVASVFAENQKIFASSRNIRLGSSGKGAYGLTPEIAWNYGISYTQKIKLFEKKGTITVDYFKTDFVNQVVVDYDQSARDVWFYNLEGKSSADSFLVEVDYLLAARWGVKLAYKYNNFFTDYTKGRLQNPLQPQNLYFANMGYETEKKVEKQWKFDTTFSWIGTQRLPDTSANLMPYQRPSNAPAYGLLNAQVTYVFSNAFEWYAGGENLTNTTQKNPIIASEDPFGTHFDTTMVYAPIMGAIYYSGIRYKI